MRGERLSKNYRWRIHGQLCALLEQRNKYRGFHGDALFWRLRAVIQ